MAAPATILWDFDGTILPMDPYDSEQTLLLRRSPSLSWHQRLMARAAIIADVREWSAIFFKKTYISCMTGCRRDMLDTTGRVLAAAVSQSCRKTLRDLYHNGHPMVVLSCGTGDIIETVLDAADIRDCFTAIGANAFRIEKEVVTGFRWKISGPEGKVAWARAAGIDLQSAIAVGDGYTDIPLLDHVGTPVMIDRNGQKRVRYSERGYRFIRRIADLPGLLAGLFVQ